ncbi:TSL-kinase interacting protein 1 [Striga asiatica]|uniref:TSL-kinase interacting protein 1 n=1 Tax=Striga asiatica TaxID=4170 RepID=A0A5A7QIL0_STRAF|nr:TSL-kinase interacting protein 1 [Striga asiatica]
MAERGRDGDGGADGCRGRDGDDKCRSASSLGRQNRAHLLLHWRGRAARGSRRRADEVLHGRIHVELTLTGRRQMADRRDLVRRKQSSSSAAEEAASAEASDAVNI